MSRSTRTSRLIRAAPDAVYGAFVDPEALIEWLPPAGMTGRLHSFDGRPGGGFEMSLYYSPDERLHRGKTAEREDRVSVRFIEMTPPRRIVESVRFVSDDSAFHGAMTLTVSIEPRREGSEVTLAFDNLPPGLSAEDNDLGARLSLEQLARRLETTPPSDLQVNMARVDLGQVPEVLVHAFQAEDPRHQEKAREQENLRLLGEMVILINTDRFDELGRYLAPDVTYELVAPASFPWARSAAGPEQVIQALAENFASVTGQRVEPVSLVAQGDQIMLMVRESGRWARRDDGYEVLTAQQYAFRDGLLASFRSVVGSLR